jgi:hypothetical protein
MHTVFDTSVAELRVLLQITQLDFKKIRQYLSEIQESKDLSGHRLFEMNRVLSSPEFAVPFDEVAAQRSRAWFGHIFTLKDLPSHLEPLDLIPTLQWAQEAKRHHLEFLQSALCISSDRLPRWLWAVIKLGRYGIASRVLVQFAHKFPALFNPMTVEPIPAPASTRFTLSSQESPLTSVLRRTVGANADRHLTQLARVWSVADPEVSFRTACSLNLIVHAEMQLVSFYDHNPALKPSFRFIGVSKKSCFLCRTFLATHPESFTTSSCHQKLYPSWMPPPAIDARVYRRYKALTTDISRIMETTVKEELETRLGTRRLPIPADSTAGVSLSGSTSPDLAAKADKIAIDLWTNSGGSQSPAEVANQAGTESEIPLEQVLSHIEVVDLTTHSEELCLPSKETLQFLDMAILFTEAEDATKQDVVRMSDILDLSTQQLSWSRLLEILEVGIGFAEGHDSFMVNAQIRITNERQFFACLQYLHNLNIFSAHTSIQRR